MSNEPRVESKEPAQASMNRREVLKKCAHFTLIVGGVAALTSEGPPTVECGDYNGTQLIPDADCNVAPSYHADSDCGKAIDQSAPGGSSSTDEHCGVSNPGGTFTPPDACCGFTATTNPTHTFHHDVDCGQHPYVGTSTTYRDDDCGLVGFSGTRMRDNDCGKLASEGEGYWTDDFEPA